MKKEITGWEESFDKKFGVTYEKQELPTITWEFYHEVKSFIQSQIASAVEARAQEIIELSDKIESENSTEFNEWRAFKGFRNTLRDKYIINPSKE